MNSDFHSKMDQNSSSPPASRYTQEALRNAKHPPTVTRTMANHGSLSNGMLFGVMNRPASLGAPRGPPFRARPEQRFPLQKRPKQHIPVHTRGIMRRKTPSRRHRKLGKPWEFVECDAIGGWEPFWCRGATRSPPFRAQQVQLGAAGKCQELGEMPSRLGKYCPASKTREKMTSKLESDIDVQFFSCT
jgi:hypothetical protein